MNKSSIIVIFGLILVFFLMLFVITKKAPQELPNQSVSNEIEAAIQAKTVEFGTQLQKVSLLMSPEDVKRQMQEHYAEFLTTDLLTSWQNNPSLALGRSVSSPWPDKIDVVEVTKVSDDTYKAEGNVIEVANTNSQIQPVAVYPVTLLYRMENGEWKIFGLQKGAYSELPKRITVTGLWECLPHKDTTGPQTEECALGIAVDQSDAHYALDLNLMSATPIDFATGTHIRVQGVMTPANQLNTNIWQKYPIDGIISATSIEKL